MVAEPLLVGSLSVACPHVNIPGTSAHGECKAISLAVTMVPQATDISLLPNEAHPDSKHNTTRIDHFMELSSIQFEPQPTLD